MIKVYPKQGIGMTYGRKIFCNVQRGQVLELQDSHSTSTRSTKISTTRLDLKTYSYKMSLTRTRLTPSYHQIQVSLVHKESTTMKEDTSLSLDESKKMTTKISNISARKSKKSI